LMMRASRAAQIAHRPDQRPYVVTRSGMAGMQRYAQTWSGDNFTDWKTLRYNQKMGLGLALSGVSNTGHDIGGFAGPAPEPELLLRWVQAGIMMPRFSIHSWNSDGTVNEPWMFPEATPAIAEMMAFRQALIPLLYDLLWRHHNAYQPVTRPLWLDFPADPQAWEDGDSYLLGADLLVAPAMEKGATTVTTYLPKGADRVDIRNDRPLAGGRQHTLPAPLSGLPPLCARVGSAVFVDMAPGGFARRPCQPGVLLYPPAGAGTMQWTGFDDDGEAWPDLAHPPLWRIDVETTAQHITITAGWTGPSAPPADRFTIALPNAETRAVSLNGAPAHASVETRLGAERQIIVWQ